MLILSSCAVLNRLALASYVYSLDGTSNRLATHLIHISVLPLTLLCLFLCLIRLDDLAVPLLRYIYRFREFLFWIHHDCCGDHYRCWKTIDGQVGRRVSILRSTSQRICDVECQVVDRCCALRLLPSLDLDEPNHTSLWL